MNQMALQWVDRLHLEPHPEGGYYARVYQSDRRMSVASSPGDRGRACCTHIYYLLEGNDFSAFHRIGSDELWHFYAGHPLRIYELDKSGRLQEHALQEGSPFAWVAAGNWFGARLETGGYALVGCTVSPGFDFQDFELARREDLARVFPQHRQLIYSLTR
ncbi:MAG TPA: cupin domain-containing protein [Chitinophagaceae bacterium]|nr:cupin domain-containing protein [Chitinophagaceae bacterium]